MLSSFLIRRVVSIDTFCRLNGRNSLAVAVPTAVDWLRVIHHFDGITDLSRSDELIAHECPDFPLPVSGCI